MNKNNIDQALLALGDALKSQEPEFNALQLIAKFPDRSLSGNHISGGKILNFQSSGIKDTATETKITIANDKVSIQNLHVKTIAGSVAVAGDMDVAGVIRVDTLEVKNLKADLDIDQNKSIKYTGDVNGKGFLWAGKDHTRQFVYQDNRIFSSESIDIAKDKNFSINNIKILDQVSLGESVVKSNLKQLGTLNGLVVNGSMSINNYMIYDSNSDRLGLGTDEPNAAFSVAEDGIEVIIGTTDASRGKIGTFASHDLDLVTDDLSRISIGAGGNILLGNRQSSPVQVSVHGKLSIRVNVPDPEVDLHVNGPIRFHGKLQKYDVAQPSVGDFNVGDIVWNGAPDVGKYVGWICVKAGNPGLWQPFGKIGNQ